MRPASVKPLGWISTTAPSSSALAQNGANRGSDSSSPFTLVRICAPFIPSSRIKRSSSAAAAGPSCMGTVPMAANRSGFCAAKDARPALTIRAAAIPMPSGTA